MYSLHKASPARQREAQAARDNRAEIVKALSQGQISRRDLFKWGIFTGTGALVLKNGLSPFARSAFAAVPTGTPRSYLYGQQKFTTPLPRLAVQKPYTLTRDAASAMRCFRQASGKGRPSGCPITPTIRQIRPTTGSGTSFPAEVPSRAGRPEKFLRTSDGTNSSPRSATSCRSDPLRPAPDFTQASQINMPNSAWCLRLWQVRSRQPASAPDQGSLWRTCAHPHLQ